MPNGAGNCPIMYVKLTDVRAVKVSTAADIAVSKIKQASVIRSAARAEDSKQAIAQIIAKKIQINGRFCTNGMELPFLSMPLLVKPAS